MPKSQAPLKTFMEVTYVCYTAYCSYFLAAGFAHIIFYFIFSQLPYCTAMKCLSEKVRNPRKQCEGYALHSPAIPHRAFNTLTPGNDLAAVIVSSQTHLWQCSSQIIAISHLLLLMQLPVLRIVTTALDDIAA